MKEKKKEVARKIVEEQNDVLDRYRKEIEHLHITDADLQSAQEELSDLGEALESYTDPNSPDYDPEFDKQIRESRPDWFADR